MVKYVRVVEVFFVKFEMKYRMCFLIRVEVFIEYANGVDVAKLLESTVPSRAEFAN